MTLGAIVGVNKAVIGMVHLRALPGSARWAGSMEAVVQAALADARALADGGADALLVENYGDMPFTTGRVDSATVAGMAVVIGEIKRAVTLPIGVNVLRSDALSALAVAAAVGGRFVRVNVHVGAVVADQGILQSCAHVPLLVGSGATPETAAALLSIADGLIVGTAVKRDGILANPVDPGRVRQLVEAARG